MFASSERAIFFRFCLLMCLAVSFAEGIAQGSDAIGVSRLPLPARTDPVAAPSATVPSEPSTSLPQPRVLNVTVGEAIVLALANNLELRVRRADPEIQATLASEARALFDPIIGGEIARRRERYNTEDGLATGVRSLREDETSARVFLREFLPTGTTIEAEATTSELDGTLYTDKFAETRVGLTVTQALLRGASVRANLVELRQARIDVKISDHEFRSFVEGLVADVEKTYWDYALAESRIQILEESRDVAAAQLRDIKERIDVGVLSRAELAAAEAELAQRQQELIDAHSEKEVTRLRLLRLLNPPVGDLWEMQVEIENRPEMPEVSLDPVADHVAVAQRLRPDINQAKLEIQRGTLEVTKTRNGLLPKLDFFITMGRTGYADSFKASTNRIDHIHHDIMGGVRLELPVINREARAGHSRARMNHAQELAALRNLEHLAAMDVRAAYIEVERARALVAATRATRGFRDESQHAETEKFRAGKSTTFLVARAQRDVLTSKLSEVASRTAFLKGLVDLYLLEGSLLERRGVHAPGRMPVSERP